MSLGISQRSIN
ncbi:hypothetical protein MXB_5063 [Myxobolus squamalis]|nr:hypothetical protein MXB_5063 [Myxobolus squamalis]